MAYQSIVLAAGSSKPANLNFRKCEFLYNGKETLLQYSINNFSSARRTIVALNSIDYDFFRNHSFSGSAILLNIARPTQGALATAGICLDLLLDDIPIVISAVDGICIGILDQFLKKMSESDADGGAVVFPSLGSDYSYVRISKGSPIEFAEKIRIGDLATAGIFYFKNKKLLTDSILWAILNQIRYEEKYYLSSAMNKFIFENKKVALFQISEDNYFRFSTEKEAIDSRARIIGG
jgi:hypothetical protein